MYHSLILYQLLTNLKVDGYLVGSDLSQFETKKLGVGNQGEGLAGPNDPGFIKIALGHAR